MTHDGLNVTRNGFRNVFNNEHSQTRMMPSRIYVKILYIQFRFLLVSFEG